MLTAFALVVAVFTGVLVMAAGACSCSRQAEPEEGQIWWRTQGLSAYIDAPQRPPGTDTLRP